MIFLLVANGCALFPNNNQNQDQPVRPGPVRPRSTPRVSPVRTPMRTPMMTPAGSPMMSPATDMKRQTGVSGVSEKTLTDRLNQIEKSVQQGNWQEANSETNRLGLDMGRYQPGNPELKGKKLNQIARFDLLYGRLQVDVKGKNKTATLRDLQDLRDALQELRQAS